MMEIRWYTHPDEYYNVAEAVMGVTIQSQKIFPGVRVLQFRQEVHPDNAPASYENGKAWSKWEDIPEVKGMPPKGVD